ncbi:MAG TPA: alpha/beta hydrolase [Vicinamibacterales bacterium]|nr:alpha/beta hydrolase [Vicinamibacterales bacterium]
MGKATTLDTRYSTFLRTAPARSMMIDGVEWQWREAGDGDLAVVILPGAVGGADLFFLLFEELQPLVRVLAVNLPFVDDATLAMSHLDRLLASRGVERAIFLGASFSGLFVQAFARQHPWRTRALILSHTGALNAERAMKQRAYARRAGSMPMWAMRGLLRLVVRLLLRGVPERGFWTARYDAALQGLNRNDLVSRYLLEATIEELPQGHWDGDVLIIHSDNDVVARPAEQSRLRAAFPSAQWVEFKRAGHSSYTRDPAAYTTAVRQFVAHLLIAEAPRRGLA